MQTNLSPELYPFEGRYYDGDGGIRMHYLDEGDGAPVVMVHGNPTWSFYYRDLVKALRDNYRCIVPDHVGCGLSDKPDDTKYAYRLEQRVNDLEALLDHLGVRENITLIVHDWGGMIGMAYAARHPERIARLVIMNTAAFPLPESKPFPWPLWLTRTPLGALLVRRFNAFSRVAAHVCCTRRKLSREVRDHYAAPYDSWQNRIATLRFVQDIPLKPSDPSYPVVQQTAEKLHRFAGTPTLILWGMRDFVFDTHFLSEWEQRLPNAEVHRFEDCGHYVLEDARDEILALVRDFLERHPIKSSA